jgi:hypothetical protein
MPQRGTPCAGERQHRHVVGPDRPEGTAPIHPRSPSFGERPPPGVGDPHADNLDRPPACSISGVAVANPSSTNAASMLIVKPCARRVASVHPSEQRAITRSTRRHSALIAISFRIVAAPANLDRAGADDQDFRHHSFRLKERSGLYAQTYWRFAAMAS